jgi:hypothetical protein
MNQFAVEMQDELKQFVTPEGGVLAAVNHVTMQIKAGEFFSLLIHRVVEKQLCSV